MATAEAATRLPEALTSFIGRQREVDALAELLPARRLLTVTGAGGSGKTRLAIEAARRVAAASHLSLKWVDLAPLADAELLGGYVAAAVGVEPGARSPEAALVDAFRDTELLLLFDNCEHLVDAAAQLADALLRGCPRLRILATSREALGIAGEQAWLIPALGLPVDGEPSLDVVSDAVSLFVDRARGADSSFALSERNVSAVSQIVRRLDGLPLAIELAAARVRSLPPEQIAARLDDSFRLLTTGARTAVPRHRTLREAVDWSYRLLDAPERVILQRLSVFAGDWSLDAAERVCADADVPASEVLDVVGALVDKSLVTMQEEHGTARYRLLETIRQFAAERLTESGDATAVATRHAHVFVELLRRQSPLFITRERPVAVQTVKRDLDNVRAALSQTRQHDRALHVELVGMLTWLWYSLGMWAEGRRRLEEAIAVGSDGIREQDRAAVLFGAGALASLQADAAAARGWLEECLAICVRIGDDSRAAYARNYLAMALVQQGRPESEALAREALAYFSAAGDPYGQRLALLLIATLYMVQGTPDRAIAPAEEAAVVARRFGLDREIGIAVQVLSTILVDHGDLSRSAALTREALTHFQRDPQPLFMARALEIMAIIVAAKRPLDSARLFGAAEAARERIGAAIYANDRKRVDDTLRTARAATTEAGWSAAWSEGRALTLDRAIEEVLAQAPATGDVVSNDSVSAALVAEQQPALRVFALGPLQIWRGSETIERDDWRSARSRELLLYLLVHPDGRTREQIGMTFWPDASAAQVKNNFHVTLHHLRKALGGSELVLFEGNRYRIAWEAGVEFDVARFEQTAKACLLAVRKRAGDVNAFEAAVQLYRGDFLADESAGDWHLETRDRVARLYVELLSAFGTLLEGRGNYSEAARAYERLVKADELNEEAHRLFMGALARSGDRGRALKQFERLLAILKRELDAEPQPETHALYQRIRRAEAV